MSLNPRPPQITDAHLRRKAIAYIRQSSEEQVRYNVGSTAIQRDLPLTLHRWGWAQESIEILDGDLGVSGSHAGLRHGFNTLLESMEAGGIGIVAVSDISRLGRNLTDLAKFADTAHRRGVLLCQGGQITDFSDPNSEFLGMILGLNAKRENRVRADYARRARRKKAEAGIATTAAPAGYVAERGGTWQKDPDERVRDVIQLVFDKFLELGSCGRVRRYFIAHGILIPRPRARGVVTWGSPSRVRIHRILRNPAYAGVYEYGATHNEDGVRAKVSPGDRLYFENHHEPYIARHRWAEIQERLSSNRRSIRPPMGRGDALLQGILRCTHHQRGFVTAYPARERRDGTVIRRAVYRCFNADTDAKFCSVIRASILDQVVERTLLSVLKPPAADVIQEITREAQREHEAILRLRESKERHAEQAAAEAERAYHQADSTHALVRQRLGARFEEALRHLDDVRTEHKLHPVAPQLILDEPDRIELRQLLADLPALWRHPRVTPAQRKAVARSVITAVYVTPGPGAWAIEIEWVGGERTRLDLLTSQGVRALIDQAARDGCTPSEIARLLGDRGAVQRSGPQIGHPYTAASVKILIRKFGWDRELRHQAYAYVRERYLSGIPLRQIANELNARAIPHPGGPWTERRVQGTVYRLRRHSVVGVPTLPPIERLDPKVLQLHDAGLSPSAIAAQLRADGLLTMHRRPVSPKTVRQILRRHRPSPPLGPSGRRRRPGQPAATTTKRQRSIPTLVSTDSSTQNAELPQPKSSVASRGPRPGTTP